MTDEPDPQPDSPESSALSGVSGASDVAEAPRVSDASDAVDAAAVCMAARTKAVADAAARIAAQDREILDRLGS